MAKLSSLVPGALRDRIRRSLESRYGKTDMSRIYEIVVTPDHKPLTGSVAVVTGASGVIGRAIAVRLAADGAEVVAVGRDAEKLEAVAQEIRTLGGRVRTESVDLTDHVSIGQLVQRVGRADILVNNAGGSSRQKNMKLWEQTTETIDDVLSVNLRATMLCTAAFGREMVQAMAGGRVINLGSTVAVGGLSNFSDYAAAKAGVTGFTRSAALEFGPLGITVNCVTPGIVQRGEISEKKVLATLRKSVLPQLGRAEDIAEMVCFLASPKASWITGQEFVIDGGRSIGLHGEP